MPYHKPVPHKVCSDCKQDKPAAEFNRQPGNRDGLVRRCRECQRIFAQKYKGRYNRTAVGVDLVETAL